MPAAPFPVATGNVDSLDERGRKSLWSAHMVITYYRSQEPKLSDVKRQGMNS